MLVTLLTSACNKEKPTHTMRFYVEADNTGSNWSQTVTMPKSKIDFIVHRFPVMVESNVIDVQLMKVDSGLCLLFVFDDQGTRELYRQSVSNNGRRVVTIINGEPIGARQFDGPIVDGALFTFTELPDEALHELVESLQKNIQIIQKLKSKNAL